MYISQMHKLHYYNTASVHMKDQCYSHMNNQKFVGALLLDATAEFSVTDQNICMEKLKIKSFLSGKT